MLVLGLISLIVTIVLAVLASSSKNNLGDYMDGVLFNVFAVTFGIVCLITFISAGVTSKQVEDMKKELEYLNQNCLN